MKIKISNIDLKAKDDRGSLHYFNTDRSGEFLLVYRHVGAVSGQHYHTGTSAYKNPEDMLLVQGQLMLKWKDLNSLEEGEIMVEAPSRVLIPAGIWHQTTAITDIIFVELNSLADGSEDTHRL
jgi:dTDP-4-dehydrorhamnose 3,5-epimerase-like enzyme